MKSRFRNLSPEKRQQMKSLLHNWKLGGGSVDLLEEGLRMLSLPKREYATSIMADEELAPLGFICTWGKGVRAKLALDKPEAELLRDLVSKLCAMEADEPVRKELMDAATSVLLNGSSLPFSDDPKIERLRALLEEFEPSVTQGSLF